MEIGNRVYVDTFLFSGDATITYIAPSKDREIFPIQIELDEPDENGHKIFRVNISDIKERPETKHQVKKDEPNRYIAVVSNRNSSFIIGEKYIISEINENGYYHVYLLDHRNKVAIGSYRSNFFKIISDYQEEISRDVVRTPERIEFKVLEQKLINNTQPIKKVARSVQKDIKNEQLDMFDLLLEGIL